MNPLPCMSWQSDTVPRLYDVCSLHLCGCVPPPCRQAWVSDRKLHPPVPVSASPVKFGWRAPRAHAHTLANTWWHTNTPTQLYCTVTIPRHTVGSSLLHWPSSFTVTLGPKLSTAKYTQAMNAIFTSSPSLVPVCEKVRRAKRGKLCFSAFLILWAKFSRALRTFANQRFKKPKRSQNTCT